MRIRPGDAHVCPALADMAAVQSLRLIRLSDGDDAVPSDLRGSVAKPNDLQPEHLGELGHRSLDLT
jgi:hypothetical protein